MAVVGLDLHKSYSYLTVMDKDGQVMDEVSLSSRTKEILNYLAYVDQERAV